MTFGPYGKDIHFRDFNPKAYAEIAEHGPYMNWETPNPDWCVAQGYVVIRVDQRSIGASPGRLDPFSHQEAEDFYDAIERQAHILLRCCCRSSLGENVLLLQRQLCVLVRQGCNKVEGTSAYSSKKVLTMQTLLLFLNLLVSLASAGAAVIALIRPGSFSGSSQVGRGEIFYVRMYAARSIPFGLAAGILPYWPGGSAVAWVLLTAAVIQIVDVVIAAGKKEWGMMIGASVGAIVHLLCSIAIR